MPIPPSDNKNKPQPFSVDDMLDRLKAQPEERGSSRIVTREVIDGQTVDVVRKRKRRTHQPKKEKEKRMNRMKRLLLLVALPVTLLLIALVVTTLFRYQGESFRGTLSDRLSEMLGARTEVSRLQVKGLSAITPRVLVTGNPGSLLKEAEFGVLNAQLAASSFFSRDWMVDNLNVQSGRFVLRPPGVHTGARLPPPPSGLLAAGLGLSPKPHAIELGMLRVTACDLVWDAEDRESSPQTVVDSALVSTTSFGSNAVLALRGGQLKLPNWPEMDIDEGDVALTPGAAEIRDATLHRKNFGDPKGSARLTGTVGLTSGSNSTLTVDLKGMELRGLVPDVWVSRIVGLVTARLDFGAVLGRSGSLQAEGDFVVANAVLGDLSCLKQLATYAGEARLTRLEFESLSGHYRKTALGSEVSELKGEVSDLFRVRGGFAIAAEGAISGQLEIGLAETLLKRRSGGIPPFFGPAEDGFCWVTTTLKGRSSEPLDDLNPRFEEEDARQRLRAAPLDPDENPPSPQNAVGAPAAAAVNPPASPEREKMLEDTFESLIGE